MNKIKNLASFSIIFFSFLISFKLKTLINYPDLEVKKQMVKNSFSSTFLKVFGLGQERLFSSMLWIDTLIDADNEHYQGKDLKSWMYLRFKTISELDPYFYQNYRFGGLYLSILKDDKLGAKDIYDRGLRYFPNDLELLKNAAFHYRFELADFQNALSLYERASALPGFPPFLRGVLARLRNNQDDPKGALEIIKDMFEKAPEGSELKDKLHLSYYSLRAQIDLKCLNSAKNNGSELDDCSRIDLEGNPYIKDKQGVYQAAREYKYFDLNSTK